MTRRNPQWAPLRHLVRIVDAVAEAGGTDAVVITSEASSIERLADRFTGKHARFTPAIALSENFPLALEQKPDFDLCLCILAHPELREFPRIVEAIAPCMRPGGKVVGFHLNASLAPLPANDPGLIVAMLRLMDTMRVHYAGSPQSARVLWAMQRAAAGGGHELTRAARIVLAQLRALPQALAINRAEAAMAQDSLAPPAPCTSITLEVTVGDHPQARPLRALSDQTRSAGLAQPDTCRKIRQFQSIR